MCIVDLLKLFIFMAYFWLFVKKMKFKKNEMYIFKHNIFHFLPIQSAVQLENDSNWLSLSTFDCTVLNRILNTNFMMFRANR